MSDDVKLGNWKVTKPQMLVDTEAWYSLETRAEIAEAQLAAVKADRDRILAMLEPSDENVRAVEDVMIAAEYEKLHGSIDLETHQSRKILTHLHTKAKDGE